MATTSNSSRCDTRKYSPDKLKLPALIHFLHSLHNFLLEQFFRCGLFLRLYLSYRLNDYVKMLRVSAF